jgi:2-oxoglutarate dehydrogenase complex dihydrolipoamide succinyltransferase (E2) component
MKVEIIMPKMGESINEGTIIKWHKVIGDTVLKDEILYDISTDKVDTEIPSPENGILAEINVLEQETVAVGTVVAVIETNGEIPAPHTEEDKKPVEINEVIPDQKSNKFYSQLILNVARDENISLEELSTITGSGNGGRITKNDLTKYIENKKHLIKSVMDSPETDEPKVSDSKSSSRIEIVPMDNNRQRIMNHMIESKETSVHVTQIMEADMSRIYNLIEKSSDKYLQSDGIKLTYLSFISFAVIKALKEYPMMNASIEGNNILIKHYINLGIAVALKPNGLIVPNIKSAEEKNIIGLAKSITDISLRARSKKLVPDDIADGTFTITNYGVFGSLFGTPIINQPEVGILGVGAVTKKPVVVENGGLESIAIKPMMFLSLSHDHRLVDGMLGGKFMKSVKDSLENFDTGI